MKEGCLLVNFLISCMTIVVPNIFYIRIMNMTLFNDQWYWSTRSWTVHFFWDSKKSIQMKSCPTSAPPHQCSPNFLSDTACGKSVISMGMPPMILAWNIRDVRATLPHGTSAKFKLLLCTVLSTNKKSKMMVRRREIGGKEKCLAIWDILTFANKSKIPAKLKFHKYFLQYVM